MKSVVAVMAVVLLLAPLAACVSSDPSAGQLRSGPEVTSAQNLAALSQAAGGIVATVD